MNLTLAILASLHNVHPRLLPEPALHVDANSLLPSPVTRAELQAELASLERRALIIGVTDALLGLRKWRLSDSGLAALASSTAA